LAVIVVFDWLGAARAEGGRMPLVEVFDMRRDLLSGSALGEAA
jgi:hypothetical protein